MSQLRDQQARFDLVKQEGEEVSRAKEEYETAIYHSKREGDEVRRECQ
jgi:hypothetical protein